MDATSRSGPFWDVLAGRAPPPPCSQLLGWHLRAVDPDAGTIEVGFQGDERFANPEGAIQGGFVAAMLDDTLGPALVATLPPDEFAPTLDLQVRFLRPARPGLLVGHGRVVHRGRAVCALAGELTDADGAPLATATASALRRPIRGTP